MDRKAFTLVEMLAVILLLGVVLSLVIPNILNVIQKNSDKVFKVKEEQIAKAASDYVLLNDLVLPTEVGSTYLIGFNTLIEADAIKEVYESDSICNGYVYIIKKDGSGYEYISCIFCNKYETDNLVCNINNLD